MAFHTSVWPCESAVLIKTARDLLCITHPVAADWDDIIIQPLLVWKHGVTAEKQTERNMADETLTAGLKEKERKHRQTKRKCVGGRDTDPAMTAGYTTTRASGFFWVSLVWGRKVGKDYRAKVERQGHCNAQQLLNKDQNMQNNFGDHVYNQKDVINNCKCYLLQAWQQQD